MQKSKKGGGAATWDGKGGGALKKKQAPVTVSKRCGQGRGVRQLGGPDELGSETIGVSHKVVYINQTERSELG